MSVNGKGLALVGFLALAMPSVPVQAAASPTQYGSRTFYVVSLEAAPLSEAVDAVLVQSLGASATIDAGLEAEISFRVTEALTPAALTERFAAALADQDVALVRVGEGFRLMSTQAALSASPRPDIVNGPPPPMRPGARAALAPATAQTPETASPSAGPERLRGWIVAGLIGLALIVLAAWLATRGVGATIWTRIVARRVEDVSHVRDRDAVVDRLFAGQSIDLSLLAAACEISASKGVPVEHALVVVGAVTDTALAEAYAEVAGLQVWNPVTHPTLDPDMSLAALAAVLRDRGMALVEADDWGVMIATPDPLDDQAFAAVSRAAGRMVTLRVGRTSDLPEPAFSPVAVSDVVVPWGRGKGREAADLLRNILDRQTLQTDRAPIPYGPAHSPPSARAAGPKSG